MGSRSHETAKPHVVSPAHRYEISARDPCAIHAASRGIMAELAISSEAELHFSSALTRIYPGTWHAFYRHEITPSGKSRVLVSHLLALI